VARARFIPQWDGAFLLYSRKWVNNNLWRVRHTMNDEDALQQCALVFATCSKRYAGKICNPAHFMALFKTALYNEWCDLATYDGRYAPTSVTMPVQPNGAMHDYHEASPAAQVLVDIWHSASADLKLVLNSLAQSPNDFLDLMLEDDPAYLNTRMKRLHGIRGDADLVGELRTLLS
jgi:hypothetical protein